jgi:hypothetical protein
MPSILTLQENSSHIVDVENMLHISIIVGFAFGNRDIQNEITRGD